MTRVIGAPYPRLSEDSIRMCYDSNLLLCHECGGTFHDPMVDEFELEIGVECPNCNSDDVTFACYPTDRNLGGLDSLEKI